MDVIISLALIFVLLLTSVILGISVLYPLIIGLIIFSILSLKKGFTYRQLFKMIFSGALKTEKIYSLLILVGLSIGLWNGCGTIPTLIYTCLKFVNPNYFLLFSFFSTFLVSLALGSAFGTTGTIGIVLITLAKAANLDLNLVGATIISAVYIGERSTPLSSCANLISALTYTNLYENLKNMFSSGKYLFFISLIAYGAISLLSPANANFDYLIKNLETTYTLSPLCLIPIFIIFIMAFFKADIKLTLSLSIISSIFIGIYVEHTSLSNLFSYSIFGYYLDSHNPLSSIIKGGGILNFVKTILIIMVSSAYAGIFEGTSILKFFEKTVSTWVEKFGVYMTTFLVSFLGCAFGCSQTFGVITSYQFMNPHYKKDDASRSKFALDLGNTALLMAPLIPWNIGSIFPATVLGISAMYIPYAFFLYLLPISLIFKHKK